MDCIFNLQIPASTKNKVIIRPVGKTFVNGIANSYSMTYPRELLAGRLNEMDFKNIMEDINEGLMSYWPCCYCFCFGYGCALCTLGLSFIGPYICIKDAQDCLEQRIENWNRNSLSQKGLFLSLHVKCSTSWVRQAHDVLAIT